MSFRTEESESVYGAELALFDVPPTNSGVEKVKWIDHRPVSQASEEGPLEFTISGSGNQYLDLKRTRLHVKVKVVKGDKSSLVDNEHVGPVNLLLQSLWSQVDVYLQHKLVSSAGTSYPYKAYLDTLLQCGMDKTPPKFQSQMYYHDSSHAIDTADPLLGGNEGLTSRANLVAKSNIVDLEGPLLSDVCQMSRYLLNNIDVDIKLWPSKQSFRLMSDTEGADYQVVIVDARLKACTVTVSPEIVMGHNEILKSTTAKYPFWRSEIKNFSISAGQFNFEWDNMFMGQVPTKMILGLTSAATVSGNYKKNPFSFQHYNLDYLSITVDGENIPGRPLEPKFSKKGGQNYISAYNTLFSDLQSAQAKEYGGISRADYPLGYTFYVFDLEPALTSKDYWPILKRGKLKVELHFAESLKETVNFLVYATFPALFEVDSSRAVLV